MHSSRVHIMCVDVNMLLMSVSRGSDLFDLFDLLCLRCVRRCWLCHFSLLLTRCVRTGGAAAMKQRLSLSLFAVSLVCLDQRKKGKKPPALFEAQKNDQAEREAVGERRVEPASL